MNSLQKACKPIDCTGKSLSTLMNVVFCTAAEARADANTPNQGVHIFSKGSGNRGVCKAEGFITMIMVMDALNSSLTGTMGPISLMRHGQKCKKKRQSISWYQISCFHFWTIVVCFMQLFVSWIIKWILPGGDEIGKLGDWEFRPGLNLRSIEERFRCAEAVILSYGLFEIISMILHEYLNNQL